MKTFSENISTGHRSYGVSKPVGRTSKEKKQTKAQWELERQIRILKDLLMWPSISEAVKKAADQFLKQLEQKRTDKHSENPHVPQGNYYHKARGWY